MIALIVHCCHIEATEKSLSHLLMMEGLPQTDRMDGNSMFGNPFSLEALQYSFKKIVLFWVTNMKGNKVNLKTDCLKELVCYENLSRNQHKYPKLERLNEFHLSLHRCVMWSASIKGKCCVLHN